MSGLHEQAKRLTPILIAGLVATLVVGTAAVATSRRRQVDRSFPVAAVAARDVETTPVDEPDPDEDIHSLPTASSHPEPADKSTISPPPADSGLPYDAATSWDTGVGTGSAPLGSSAIVTRTVWGGFVDGLPVAVYAGYAGYEHPHQGAIYVLYGSTESRAFDFERSFLLPVEGADALTVVDGHDDGSVEMVSASGQHVRYDLRSQTVTVR